MQDPEDELKKQTNKNHPDILNNPEPSPEASRKEAFKGAKEITGNGSCMSSDDFVNSIQRKGIQVPHKWIAEKRGEKEHSSKPMQDHLDNAKISDASLTAKVVDDHDLKEKVILSYSSSGTFSSKMPESLPYIKEDQKYLNAEQEVLYSHPELSDCEHDILSHRPGEKCACQMVHNTREKIPRTPDLDVPELKVSEGYKQLNSILNMQSQTFNVGHKKDPRPRSVDPRPRSVDHVPLHTKHSLDMRHLTIDLNDENLTPDRLVFLPKTLNYIEQFTDSDNSQEKRQKVTESEEEIMLKNIEGSCDKTGTEGILGKKHNEDSQIHEKSTDNIVTLRQKDEMLGSDSEEDEVQKTKAINDSADNLKTTEQENQEEMYKHTQEKSVTIDLRDSRKDNTFSNQKTVPAVLETVKDYKLISDNKLALKEASTLSGFPEHYINLVQESKRIFQATRCESYELLLLQQEFENHFNDITDFPCEEVFSERKQVLTSVEYENKFMNQRKRCLNKKTDLAAELQSLMQDVRNKCEAQNADSGTTNTGKLSGSGAKVSSTKKPNSFQYSKTNRIPPVTIEEKICTSENSDQLNLKDVLQRNPMTQNSTFRYGK
uniref:Uncharacterized protein n=1 Tax=Sphaerodactylus townsendi TaxID=933632 RepID=A0ACB8G4H8_9SAUR